MDQGFLKRNPDLVVCKASPLDPKRAKCFNETNVLKHFTLLAAFLDEQGIRWRDVYNMDEKGIQIGGGRKNNGQKYFFSRRQWSRYRLKDENLELVTVIKCVSAEGDWLKPGFIFTGKKYCPEWFATEPCS
jgi:hypothetical protein